MAILNETERTEILMMIECDDRTRSFMEVVNLFNIAPRQGFNLQVYSLMNFMSFLLD